MKPKESCVLILSALTLTACGGGGGGGVAGTGGVGGSPSLVKTAISGTTAAPFAPTAAAPIQTAAPVPPANMLLPPNATLAAFPAIAQVMNYSSTPTAQPFMNLSTLSVNPVDTAASVTPGITGAMARDATLGQPSGITISTLHGVSLGTAAGVTAINSSVAGLPTISFGSNTPSGIGAQVAGYVLPYSSALNPMGYAYQTFGIWIANPSANDYWEGWFSTGVPTTPASLPTTGRATYTGQAAGTYVDAATRDVSDTMAMMNATADFATLSVAFATTNTSSLLRLAPPGTAWTANAGLDMTGSLNYAAGSNTFTGAITSASGMSGNATGRFYGPGIATATPTSMAGAPAEIGGTFAVMGTGIGALEGAFAGTATPAPTSIGGTVTPPAAPPSGLPPMGALSILTPPGSTMQASSVVQRMDYTLDPVALLGTSSTVRVTTLNVKPIDAQYGNSLTIKTGAADPRDPTFGQTTLVTSSNGLSTFSLSMATGAVVSQTRGIAGLPTVTLDDPATGSILEYAVPYSATLNPAGYLYQTFGRWLNINPGTGLFSENYFSAGLPAIPVHIPVNGTAVYTGQVAGTYVDATTHTPSDVTAAMNATANFTTRSITFATSGTTSLSANAAAGALPSANPGLDMSGTLSYAGLTNTFTGAVTTANGMSGNATGRFYDVGPSVVQVPHELGGTFAVVGTGIGAMQGAFGGATTPSAAPTSISGVPPLPGTGGPLSAFVTASPDMLAPPNSVGTWYTISQSVTYSFDSVAAVKSVSKVADARITWIDGTGGLTISTGAAYPTDPALGQTIGIGTNSAGTTTTYSAANGFAVSQNTDIAGLPTVTLSGIPFGGNGTTTSEYVLPYSVALNPAGYTYQTFGMWLFADNNHWYNMVDYFSAGTPTAAATLPISGTASYAGRAAGSYVNAATGVLSRTTATMNASANFAALSVAFSTSGTTSLPTTAATGALPTANPGLDMAGTLNYTAGNNTFTGTVATVNGMTGAATGRFYGPGVATATATKVAGAPPEIGGTFIVTGNGVGAMHGAFGGK